jgi:hypothetical protein
VAEAWLAAAPPAGGGGDLPPSAPAAAAAPLSLQRQLAAAALSLPLLPLQIWRQVGLPDFADLLWRLLLGKLPVLARLHFLPVADRTCAVCAAAGPGPAPPEDEAHVFCACPQAQLVWGAVAALWATFPGLPAPFPGAHAASLVFGQPAGGLATLSSAQRGLWAEVAAPLLALGRHLIWLVRKEALAALRPRPGGPAGSCGPPATPAAPRAWSLPRHRLRPVLAGLLSRHVWARFAALDRGTFEASWGTSALVDLRPEAGLGRAGLPPVRCGQAWAAAWV